MATALRPYVAAYLDVALDLPSDRWIVQRVSPPGGAGLALRWGGEIALFDETPPAITPARAFTGPLSFGGATGCRGALRMFCVLFTAAGAHDLFGLAMPPYVNRSVEAGALLGPWVGALTAALAREPDAAGRHALAEAALVERLAARHAGPGLGARAAALIDARSGCGPLADVAPALGVAERTLRRHFLREVGLPLKAYARWVRFAHARAFLEGDDRPSWADAAQRFGYADQAHLVREFRHFAGQPPTRLGDADRAFDPTRGSARGRRGRNLQDADPPAR